VESHLIWIDLEMTGLDPERHVILEIGTLVTDETLHIVAEGPAIAVNHPEHMLSTMDAWNRDHHGVSGLLDRVKASARSRKPLPSSHAIAKQENLRFAAIPCGRTVDS
jgi:oligoribonuclease